MATAFKEASRPRKGRGKTALLGIRDTKAQEKLNEDAGVIIDRLDRLANDQVRAKSLIEQRWLDDLRNYYGRYDTATIKDLKEAGRSQAFVKLTRHKTNAWAARIADLLFPTDNKNWGIQPTPLPKLAQQAKDAVLKAQAALEAANSTDDMAQQERIVEIANSFARDARLSQKEMDEVKKRCDAMEKTIEDQLVESHYVAECRDVIEDGCRLGAGILKGPMESSKLRSQWKADTGGWEWSALPDPMPEFKRIDPWHFFPDMSARTIREAEFTFERSLPTKRDLRRLAMKFGFNKDAVRRLLEDGPDLSLGTDFTYLQLLRDMSDEGEAIKDRFVMWEYHGSLECDEIAVLLRAAGRDEKALKFEEDRDPLEDYRVIVHFCGNEILKIAPEYPLDSGDTLYSVWNFEKGETSVFGVGVPHIMSDSQRAVNGAWRMMMDNSALSVGPQIVVDRNSISPVDGTWGLKPLKTWYATTTSLQSRVPPFQVFNVPNNQEQLAGIIALAREFIDDEVSLPKIDEGQQGAATPTAQGMSILANSANVIKRRVVKSWDDDLTTPTLRRAYDWNMQFNPDDAIKGDMQVDARGTSVLLQREIQSQTLMAIATNWSTHPVIAQHLDIRHVLEKTLQTMMIPPDDILRSQDEIDQEMEAAAAQPQEQETSPEAIRLQIAQITAEAHLQAAQITANVRLAELSENTGLSREELEAKHKLKGLEIESKERMRAVDIDVEEERAAKAAAAGESEKEAVGVGVG